MYRQNHLRKQCRFGLSCKFGLYCKFDHPQRATQQSGYNQYNLQNMQQIQYQLQSMNFGMVSNNFNQTNNVFMNDAQYQQQTTQNYNADIKVQNSQNYLQNQPFQILQPQQKKTIFKMPWKGKQKKQSNKYFQKESNNKYCKYAKNKQSETDSNSDQQDSNIGSESDQEQVNKHSKKLDKRNSDENIQQLKPILVEDKIKKEKKKKFKNLFKKKQLNQISYKKFELTLQQFFEKRHIKPHKREGILQYLTLQHSDQVSVIEIIIPIIEELQRQNYVQHFCYKKLFKTICKQDFNIEAIKAKLLKKINVDLKRKKKDQDFLKRFPNPVDIEFLESKELLSNQQANKNTIYLIDGNNCLVTQKHLRFYFQKIDQKNKAEAQLRFRWLISRVIPNPKRCFIFFDDKFPDQIYEEVAHQIMYEEEYENILKYTTVIYPINGQQADQLVRNKLKNLVQTISQKQLQNILLITADRVLTQQCYEIHYLRKSSGMYLMKFCKKSIKASTIKGSPQKKIIKRILTYN